MSIDVDKLRSELPSLSGSKELWRVRFEELLSDCRVAKSECADDSELFLKWCRFERELLEMDGKSIGAFVADKSDGSLERPTFIVVMPNGSRVSKEIEVVDEQ